MKVKTIPLCFFSLAHSWRKKSIKLFKGYLCSRAAVLSSFNIFRMNKFWLPNIFLEKEKSWNKNCFELSAFDGAFIYNNNDYFIIIQHHFAACLSFHCNNYFDSVWFGNSYVWHKNQKQNIPQFNFYVRK